jgi:ubiquinone biosynthesis protein
MLFLNASIAFLAPDIDIFQEIMYLVTYFTSKYGTVITEEIGVDVTSMPIDLDGVKGSLGLDGSVEQITYRELQERRELIRKRMEEHSRSRKVAASKRSPLGTLKLRLNRP